MIIAFSGLSGTGKSTIAREVSKFLKLPFVITYTTRPIRPGEINGVDYHFIDDNTWKRLELENRIVAPQPFKVANGQIWNYGIDKLDLKGDIVMVLTPSGVADLRELGYKVISYYIDLDEDIRLKRIFDRKDNQGKMEITRRTLADRELFRNFVPDYTINNSGMLSYALDQFKLYYTIHI